MEEKVKSLPSIFRSTSHASPSVGAPSPDSRPSHLKNISLPSDAPSFSYQAPPPLHLVPTLPSAANSKLHLPRDGGEEGKRNGKEEEEERGGGGGKKKVTGAKKRRRRTF